MCNICQKRASQKKKNSTLTLNAENDALIKSRAKFCATYATFSSLDFLFIMFGILLNSFHERKGFSSRFSFNIPRFPRKSKNRLNTSLALDKPGIFLSQPSISPIAIFPISFLRDIKWAWHSVYRALCDISCARRFPVRVT